MGELRTYKKKMGIFWWLQRLSHVKFITRELTSLAVAFFAIELFLLVRALLQGAESYEAFLHSLSSPSWLTFNIIATLGLVFHSVTWFNLAPKAMVIKVGKNRLPGFVVALSNYIGWVIISVIITWFLI